MDGREEEGRKGKCKEEGKTTKRKIVMNEEGRKRKSKSRGKRRGRQGMRERRLGLRGKERDKQTNRQTERQKQRQRERERERDTHGRVVYEMASQTLSDKRLIGGSLEILHKHFKKGGRRGVSCHRSLRRKL